MKRKSYLRNQYGMATWAKILLGVFGVALLIIIVGSVFVVSYFQDMTNPKKTEQVANKIVTLKDPLESPFEYGRMNISMLGWSGALIDNTKTNALFFLIKKPTKTGEDNAKTTIDKVKRGEAPLPDTSGSLPGSSASKNAARTNMNVEKDGQLDVGGTTLYYVLGKSVAKPARPTSSDNKPVEMETFLGGADPKDPSYTIFIMGQQQDPSKHLTLEDVQAFLSMIKSI